MFACLALAACNTTREQLVTLTGEFRNSSPAVISIVRYNYPLEGIEVVASDSGTTQFHHQFHLDEPEELYMSVGGQQYPLFLKPGDSLVWMADSRALPGSIRFKGDGSRINNYLVAKSEQVRNHLLETHEEQSEIPDLLLRHYQALSALLDKHVQKENVFYRVEQAALIAELHNAIYYHQLASGNRALDQNAEIPLPQDNHFLIARSYRQALRNQLQDQVILSVDNPSDYASGYHRVFVELSKNPGPVTDFLLAANLQDRIDYFGIAGLEEDYLAFKELYPESVFLPDIHSRVEQRMRLLPGNPAPDVVLQDASGNTVMLSDHFGKPVYIDVWASWCKPCIAEIPHRKMLEETLGPEVVYLNISVDNDPSDWMAAIRKYPEFKGVHLHAPDGWSSEFMQQHLIQEIPRYILLDETGIITDHNAPPPSQSKALAQKLGQPAL